MPSRQYWVRTRRFGLLRRGRRWLGNNLHFVAIGEVDRRLQDDLVTILDALADLDLGAVIGGDRDLVQMRDAVLDHRDLLAVLIEDDRRAGHDQRRRSASPCRGRSGWASTVRG